MSQCKVCQSELTLKYCANCGSPVAIKRIDGKYLVHEIEHVLHFDRGILYTIRELLLRPGQNIRRFLAEDRSRLVKPVIFIIVTSLIYTLTAHFFKVQVTEIENEAGLSTTGKIMLWTQRHYGYSNILMGAVIAVYIKLFFRKHPYNFFEILILLCFVMGVGMLFYALFALIEGLTRVPLIQAASIFIIGYCTWAIGDFFGSRKAMSYVRAGLAYLAGMLSYLLLATIIGALIDALIK